MGTDAIVHAQGRVPAAGGRSVAALSAERRKFWIGLACAAVLHALLIVGVTRSSPRIMGEKEGRPDGISVVLVDAADLKSKTTVPVETSPPGATGSIPPPPPTPREAQPQPPQPPEPQEASALPIEQEKPAAIPLPGPVPKERPPEPVPKESKTPPAKTKPKTHARAPDPPLQLSMPDMTLPSGGLGAAFSRPPGITKSGENDEFARGVIRALRRTMPPGSGVLGRVTVRLKLDDNGNLAEVIVLRPAEDPLLTQSVVFSVRQASFPFPPVGATLADRMFMVTYIYH